MHFRVTTLPGVLGRRRRFNDRRVNQRAFLHHQPTLAQRDANLVKQLPRQFVFDQQAPELQQRGCIRYVLDCQIDAGEGAQRDAVVQRVFQPFVRQSVPLLLRWTRRFFRGTLGVSLSGTGVEAHHGNRSSRH